MLTDPRALRLLILIQLVSMAAMEMSGPFWPLRIQQLLGQGADSHIPLLSALVYAGPMLAAMLLTPIWGRLGDRTGHKTMIVRALVALALCQGLAGFTLDPWLLVAIRVMQGALAGFLAAAQAYALACSDSEQRGHTLARLQSATAVGTLLGPVLGGGLLDLYGFPSLCFGATAICLVCAAGSCFLPADKASDPKKRSVAPGALPKGWLGAIVLLIVLIQAAKMLPQPFFALYVANILHAPNWLIGATYAASAATLAISAPLWGRLFDRCQRATTLRVIEGVTWLCALTLVATALADEWLSFLISRLAWGLWQGALLPVAYVLIANSVDSTQLGFALGLGNSAAKAGALLGVLLGGVGMGLVGLGHVFWLVALTYALAAIAVRWIRSDTVDPGPESSPFPIPTQKK